MLTQPDIRPVQESGQLYELMEDFEAHGIVVPKGFRHDGATMSKLLFQRDGIHRAAALVHDYIYEYKIGYTRKQADRLFKKMLKEYGVKSPHVFLAYGAVWVFGWMYWSK